MNSKPSSHQPQTNQPAATTPHLAPHTSGLSQELSPQPKSPQSKPNFRDLSLDERAQVLQELGAQRFRVNQVEEWLAKPQIVSFEAMTNMPQALRQALALRYTLISGRIAALQRSKDGTRKYLVRYGDGTCVECVGMPTGTKLSVCVSSQAGCAMGCAFCATGKHGFTRNLTAREIADQVYIVRAQMQTRVTSVVVMGQGEPFANYDATLGALRILNAPGPETIGARHLTISTAGVIPGIRRLAKESEQFGLAVSLHSAIQPTRNLLMPAMRRYPLVRLHEALDFYTQQTHRRPTYEYALIEGVNDTAEAIQALIDFCRGTLCHVNLIRLNELKDSPLRPSTEATVQRVHKRLTRAGIETTIRESRGADIDAACGQLRQRHPELTAL